MKINILASANPAYSFILSVTRGKGDAKLMCWLARFSSEFKVRVAQGAWLIQVRAPREVYLDFLNTFTDYLVRAVSV